MSSLSASVHPSRIDEALRSLHAWIWQDPHRRARKLLRFAGTEASGGRDLSRAAELTRDPLLRKLYLRHSDDEHRHAALFRARGLSILRTLPPGGSSFEGNWLSPGERAFGQLRVEDGGDAALLAFLHLSEKAAAQRFALYRQVLPQDPATREVFDSVLRDEAFHMTYTQTQLARVAGGRGGAQLWKARAGRLWKAYLHLAGAVAALLGALLLRLQYFLILPPFALFARRAARREPRGFSPARAAIDLTRQY